MSQTKYVIEIGVNWTLASSKINYRVYYESYERAKEVLSYLMKGNRYDCLYFFGEYERNHGTDNELYSLNKLWNKRQEWPSIEWFYNPKLFKQIIIEEEIIDD